MNFSQKEMNFTKPNRLQLLFNTSAFFELGLPSVKLKIFFMDKVSSPQLYIDEMEMDGRVEIPVGFHYYAYKTKISKSEHVKGDPLFECATYTANNSFDGCIKNELKENFAKEFECQPPPIAEDVNDMCNKKFNFSAKRSAQISNLFMHLALQDQKTRCKTPCIKNKYTTRFTYKTTFPCTGTKLTRVSSLLHAEKRDPGDLAGAGEIWDSLNERSQ